MTRRFEARPTTYNGIRMRSRLEAGFAQTLDQYGIKWLYEPQAFANESGQYLPDFYADDEFVEVKPRLADYGEALDEVVTAMAKLHIIKSSVPEARLRVIVGQWSPGGVWDFKYAAFCGPKPTVCPICNSSMEHTELSLRSP